MDTSKENIKMLEKAPEIQALWKPKVGDWFLNDYRGTTGFDRKTEGDIWGDDVKKWELIQCLTSASSIKDYVTISDSSTGTAHTYTMEEFFKHRHVWIPRQDQLQEMLMEYGKYNYVDFIEDFKNFAYSCYGNSALSPCGTFCPTKNGSLEQLTLAFVMERLYGKRWDGSDWVVE